jgi:hypothetical protein
MSIDLTAGGRLHVHPLVTERKVEAFSGLLDGALSGDAHARITLAETLSSSDAVFSLGQLINIRNLPQYDEAPRQGNLIASPFTVDDFRPATFYSLQANLGAKLGHGKDTGGNAGIAPKVAELDTYQYTYGYSEESVQVAIEKRGFKFGVSLERVVNDPTGEIRRVPGDMLQIGLDTEEYLIFRALQDGSTAASQLQGGTVQSTGAVVPPNAPISADAFRQAFAEIARRTDADGRKIPLARSYYVVVPVGYGEQVDLELVKARNILQVTDGNFLLSGATVPLGALGRITGVIESEWIDVSGDDVPWYLVPAAGTTRRTSLVRLNLAGYTAPEVFVSNFNGVSLGGGNVDPFRAFSFDNDSVDLKFRMFTNSALISEDQQAWSNGSGA